MLFVGIFSCEPKILVGLMELFHSEQSFRLLRGDQYTEFLTLSVICDFVKAA